MSFVFLTIRPEEFSIAIHFIVLVVPFIAFTIRPFHDSITMNFSIFKLSLISSSIFPSDFSFSIFFSFFKLTNVILTLFLGIELLSYSVWLIIFEISFVAISISIYVSSLTMHFTLKIISLIKRTTFFYQTPITCYLIILKMTLEEFISIFIFDDLFSYSYSFFTF